MRKDKNLSQVEKTGPALKVTLQSILKLWENRVGCDVVLDVGGVFLHGMWSQLQFSWWYWLLGWSGLKLIFVFRSQSYPGCKQRLLPCHVYMWHEGISSDLCFPSLPSSS